MRTHVLIALVAVVALATLGCDGDSSSAGCGAGRHVEDDAANYCAYVVVEGGFTCPPDFAFRFDIDGVPGAVCADRDIDPGDIPVRVCVAIGADDCDGVRRTPPAADAAVPDAAVPDATSDAMPDAGPADAIVDGDSAPPDGAAPDGGTPTCGAATCGAAVCGRSPCGYPCGATPPAMTCWGGALTDAPPGDPCVDAFGDRIGEGSTSYRVCPTDGEMLERCQCNGGGADDFTCAGGCVEVVLDETPRRGVSCREDGHCGDLPCNIGRCGEVCDAGRACADASLVCTIPGDVAGVCLDPCTTCGDGCGESFVCGPTALGGGAGFSCQPEGALLSAEPCP